ncbi:MAG: DEAD/DEAH box helicase, partial [Planctomycetota bacterium]
MAPLASDSPIQYVKGVGPTRAEWFATLGIRTVGQLLEYYPFRHEEDRGEVEIADVVPGANVTVRGEVVRLRRRPPGFWCEIDDGTGRCVLRWFNRPYAAKGLFLGATVVATGQAQAFGDHLELVQPRVQVFAPDAVLLTQKRGARWVGVYRGNATIKSPLIRRTVLNVLAEGPLPIEEVLPPALLAKHEFPPREQAVRSMHCPAGKADLDRARRRLAYEELLLMELAMALRRRKRLALQSGRKLPWTAEIDQRIRARFPFTLTAAQDKTIREIVADLRSGRPMTRLLQGDVGSGKTVVALYACLVAIAGGKQAAIMAPTEILAHQHFTKIDQYLRGSRVRYVLLRGKMSAKERRDALAAIERGEIDLVVGTQALIQKDVAFSELAVVIVDEQHKFGVLQRHTFRTKGPMPHYLVMTATPIPRTLAMTVFGDLDVSVIRQSPPGRGRTITKVVPLAKWEVVMTYVRKRLEAGEQAYVVCPQIGGEREEGTANGEQGTGKRGRAKTGGGLRDSGIEGLRAEERGTWYGEQGTGNREARSARRAAATTFPHSPLPTSPPPHVPTFPRPDVSASPPPHLLTSPHGDAAAIASVNDVHRRLTAGPWAGLNVG